MIQQPVNKSWCLNKITVRKATGNNLKNSQGYTNYHHIKSDVVASSYMVFTAGRYVKQ